MSLTSHLQNLNSPVRLWYKEKLNDRSRRLLLREINDEATSSGVLLPPEPHTSYSLVGTAFDYQFRWQFGALGDVVARQGAGTCELLFGWKRTRELVDLIIEQGNGAVSGSETQIRAAIMLAWFEQVFRSGRLHDAVMTVRNKPASVSTIDKLQALIPNSVVLDIQQLMQSAAGVWGQDTQQAAILNPTFEGSFDVGGADADWIINTTLYDCKCTIQKRPCSGFAIMQLLGYVLLDYDGKYDIQSVGWYFVRQQLRIVYPLEFLLENLLGNRDLASLRLSFREMITASLKQRVRRIVLND